MKLNAIWSLLKQRKRVSIQKGVDAQWIGDGFAAYPIYLFPTLNEAGIRTLLDVSEESWDKFTCEIREGLSFCEDDFRIGDKEMQELGITISFRGKELIPITDGLEIYYIPAKYLKPFKDFEPMFYLRKQEDFGDGLIVVREGMLIRGVIIPYEFPNTEAQELSAALQKTYVMTETMITEREIAEQADTAIGDFACDKGSEDDEELSEAEK